MRTAVYITRCDIGWYSKHANAYLKPLEIASAYRMSLCVDKRCRVPLEIKQKCAVVLRFSGLKGLMCQRLLLGRATEVFTGFDFPCMCKALYLKRQYGVKWTVYLWDPPSLSHRDSFPPLRWAIDAVFRFFAKRCDKLVLNIHPGLLGEIGYRPRDGQIELRMQDAFEGVKVPPLLEQPECKYKVGVLSNWSKAKGGNLVAGALERLAGVTCLWVGDAPAKPITSKINFTGRLQQNEAFDKLSKCRVLLVPYLPTHALKWNYPLKLFEYLQMGRPILASDNPGNAAIAKLYPRRITLFKSGDVDDLATKLMGLLK